MKKYLNYSLIFFVLFLFLAICVYDNTLVYGLDNYVYSSVNNDNSFLLILSKSLDFIFGNILAVLMSLGLLVLLFINSRKSEAKFAFLVLFGGFVLGQIFKWIIGRDRPGNALVDTFESSFPSGHALKALLLIGLIIYLYKDKIELGFKRNSFVYCGIIIIILVGFSRIYLGVHWFSDILGSYLLGFGWFFLVKHWYTL